MKPVTRMEKYPNELRRPLDKKARGRNKRTIPIAKPSAGYVLTRSDRMTFNPKFDIPIDRVILSGY